ncbi:MAG: hypothetical protein CVU84_15150 [Firmicutes bacterium HGW-Firmicutes-1]|nr:MAG: hypothetical protein CVU84_15150 [Firmicutes bacterium HGW-Firmicutes-1]
MSFFYSHESLTIIQWILRGILAYVILLIAAKILGQRAISQLRLLDFIIAITMGNILAHPLSDEGLGMTGSITTTSILVFMYILSLLLTLKSKVFEKFICPAPIPIIQNGAIIYKNLVKAKITLDFLLSELRMEKIEDIKKIATAFWEPSGKLSVFLNTPYQPLTPNDLQIPTKPFSLPAVVIKEGDIDIAALRDINRTKDWLIDLLKTTYNTEAKDILLATIDSNYSLHVFFK